MAAAAKDGDPHCLASLKHYRSLMPLAQEALALFHGEGCGVTRNNLAAVAWHEMAARAGHAGARNALGLRHLNGDGVARDDEGAIRWFQAAAERGYADAQFSLAIEYMSSDAYAYAWLHLAAEQGHEEADRRKRELWEYMTHDDVSLAEELSTDLAPKTGEPDPEREACGRPLAARP